MPAQENFAPCFIRSKTASSPSRLMTVRLLKSINNVRPSKSRLAFLQEVRSSSIHGGLSLPSTTNLRRDGVSTMEILNMLNLGTVSVSARCLPKPQARKVLKALVGAKSAEHYVNECQSHN